MNVDIIEPFNRLHLPGSSKISALHYSNGKLFVGLANGDITIMKVSDKAEPVDSKPRSLRSYKSFNDIKGLFGDNDLSQLLVTEKTFKNVTALLTPVTAIESIPLYKDSSRDVLLIGNSETLLVYEWVGSHLNLITSFEDAKNYSKFSYFESLNHRLLLIGSKKRLFIYKIVQKSRNIFDFSAIKEIPLKDRIQEIGCHPSFNVVILGLHHSYLVVDLDDDFSLKDLPTDDSSIYNFAQSTSFNYFGFSNTGPSISIIHFRNDRSLVVRDSQVGILEYNEGICSLSESNIKLSAIPIDVAVLDSCYLIVVYNKRLEILDIESGNLIQEFHHQMSSSSILLTIEGSNIIIGAGSNIFQFNLLLPQKQVNQFLSLRGAVSKGVKDSSNDLRLIGLQQALTLASNLDSDDEFFTNELSTVALKRKQLYIRQLQNQRATTLFESYSKYHEALVDIGSEWMLSYKDILSLFPDFVNGDILISNLNETPETNSTSYSNNLVRRVSLADVELARGVLHGEVNDSITEAEGGAEKAKLSPAAAQKGDQLQIKNQKMRRFSKAVNNLIVYLTDQRRIHLSFLSSNDEVPYIKWKGVEITPLDIYPDLRVKKLKRADLNEKLILLCSAIDTSLFLCYYHTKPMLLGPLLRLPNNRCNAKVVNECLLKDLHTHTKEQQNFIRELLDFYFGRKLHEDALLMLNKLAHQKTQSHAHEFDEFLSGPDLTINYLQKLNDDYLDLICKSSYWVLTEEEERTMERAELIFMNETYECESYDNFKVLEFFKSLIKNEELAVRYLEWLLNESDVLDSSGRLKHKLILSTKLCLLYLKRLKATKGSNDEFYEDSNYVKLYKLLESTNEYEPWTVLKNIPTSQDKFLRLTIFIYKRLGEHQKSVDVLFNQLADLDGAMQYCADVYRQFSHQTGEDLLHKLLEDLLMHYEENQDSVARLLRMQGGKMSMLRILTTLPNSFPLHKLQTFVEESVRNEEEKLSNTRVGSQLYKVGSIKLHHKLLVTESESYSIPNGKQPCPICRNKLGFSVLSVNKSNQIVHFRCLQNTK